MPVIVVANPKGGVGKSTLSTNIAGYLAVEGHKVMLGDVDRQQSSRTWLGLRPASAAPIAAWEVAHDTIVRPPKGTTHVVLDTPVLGYLRDTQNYVHLAAHGLTLWDVAPGRVARDLEQWQPIIDWLNH